jgi:hypothetical protein
MLGPFAAGLALKSTVATDFRKDFASQKSSRIDNIVA